VELIVTGFHRSGTSMVTQLLHRAGLFVGEDLLDAEDSNPYGHFEDREVLAIHRDILGDSGADWALAATIPFFIREERWAEMASFVARRQSHHKDWGFKDPRTCLFLGAWKYLLPDSRFVLVYRHPSDCARSLRRRQAEEYFSGRGNAASHLRFFRELDHAFKMWDVYNRHLIAFARAHVDDCLVLPFERLSDEYPLIRAVNRRFGIELEEVPTVAVFDPTVVTDSPHALPVYGGRVRARVAETWRDLEDLGRKTEVLL
jgi:hypothetical protein